jgi:hypothetical protein
MARSLRIRVYLMQLSRLVKTRFRYASVPVALKLAAQE